jgi:hypothetical protein
VLRMVHLSQAHHPQHIIKWRMGGETAAKHIASTDTAERRLHTFQSTGVYTETDFLKTQRNVAKRTLQIRTDKTK